MLTSNDDFKNRLAEQRRAAQLTQEQLSNDVGIDKRNVSLYENGRAFPRPEVLRALAERLGVDAQWLATGSHTATTDYLAAQFDEPRTPADRKTALLFIERWETLPAHAPTLPRYNPKPRYGLESAEINSFVPVIKSLTDFYRATRYPGAIPVHPEYPRGSILVFDARPITTSRIPSGSDVIFRLRGTTSPEPGLRRLVREPGLADAVLLSTADSGITSAPIPADPLSVEIIGIVVWQIIQRALLT